MCGKQEAFEHNSDIFETWYHRLITQLIFTQPTINATSLGNEAGHFLATFMAKEEMSSLDTTLLAVFHKDTRKV